MVIRYYLRCEHCQKTTLLRIAVGYQEKEPFYFECEHCSQAVSGNLLLDQRNARIKGLEVNGATQIDAQEADYILTYDPSFSHAGGETLDGLTLTPFLQMAERHDMLESIQRLAYLNVIAREVVPDLGRIIRNYKSGNWSQFEIGIRKHIPDDLPVALPLDRNRALYLLLELCMSPIATSKAHSELINFFTGYTVRLAQTRSDSFNAFLAEANRMEYLKKTQNEALDLYPRFFRLLDEFRPVLPEWDPEHPNQDYPADLRVTGKSGYHDLKSLYVDGYEVICRALTLVTGLINLTHRNNHHAYLPHPTLKNNFLPSSMTDFHEKSHAPKLEMLVEEPALHFWLAKSLDAKLRNAIGHNTISYNTGTGYVTYSVNRKGTSVASITYGEFLTRLLRILLRTHQMNHLVKILFVYLYWGSEYEPTGKQR
jgi:hypothetical protein